MPELVELFNRFRTAATESETDSVARAIVQMVRPRVWRMIAWGTRMEAVEEVFQDFWASLFAGLHQFRGETDDAAIGLCHAIARRRCIDWIRRQPKLKTVSMDADEFREAVEASAQVMPVAPGERLDLEEALRLVEACDPDAALFIALRYFEGHSFKEIGQRFGMTEAAVAMRVRRSIQQAQASVAERKAYV
jgi:RNA polymerase sigma factor (sigma-70 family)